MFILTTDKELWVHELMCHIMGCDHSLGFKEFLDQLNLIYIWICLYFVIGQDLLAWKLMYHIMGCDHSMILKEVFKFDYCLMVIFLTVYIFKYFLLLVPFSHQGSATMFSF
jgi:hypothetical protein